MKRIPSARSFWGMPVYIVSIIGLSLPYVEGTEPTADDNAPLSHRKQAAVLVQKGQFRQAKRHCELALRELQENTQALQLLTKCEVELGRFDDAIAHYKKLLDIDPQLKAGYMSLDSYGPAPTEIALSLARREVASLISDRPELARHLSKGDSLHEWLVYRFAGRGLCNSLTWSSDAPRMHAIAQNLTPTPFRPGEIRILKTRERLRVFGRPIETVATHDELWSSLAFELYNTENYPRLRELVGLARLGLLSRDAYAASVLLTEYEAERRALAFYVYEFYPFMKERDIETNPRIWGLGEVARPISERIASHRDRCDSVWKVYQGDYDEITSSKEVCSQ